MSKTSLLPNEILFVIFDFVADQDQLSQCRLVCKSWCDPAEKCMLGQQINLISNKTILGLYSLLLDHPHKGVYIKYLHFDVHGPDLPTVLNELMYLAITPSIEAITGFVEPHAFYTTMINIVDTSTVKFTKLRSMAHPKSVLPEYLQLMLRFTDTLQTMVLNLADSIDADIPSYITHFRWYQRLTCLKLRGNVTSIGNLMMTVNLLIHLQALTLTLVCVKNILPFADIDVPNKSLIHQCHNLKTLRIESWCTLNLLHFVLYKFPNVKGITLDIKLTNLFFTHWLHPVASMLKRRPQAKLFVTVAPHIEFSCIARILALDLSIVSSSMHAGKESRLKLQGFQP